MSLLRRTCPPGAYYASGGLLQAKDVGRGHESRAGEGGESMVKGLVEVHEGVFEGLGVNWIWGVVVVGEGKMEVELKTGERAITAEVIIDCTESWA
tara:strand:+ start:929 stop:1216 length:288 start_codon:yes stop_codon:yes gene_type:complete